MKKMAANFILYVLPVLIVGGLFTFVIFNTAELKRAGATLQTQRMP